MGGEKTGQGTPSAKRASPRLVENAAQLLDGLSRDLAEAQAGAPVHAARRRIKRLRSYIVLMEPIIGTAVSKDASRHLKTAADALSLLRRHEALNTAVQHLSDKLPKAHGLDRLVADYHEAHVVSTSPGKSLLTARQAVEAAVRIAGTWRLPRTKLPAISEAFAHTYRKARKMLRRALKSGDASDLHQARKQVIHHLHHLELLADALPRDPAPRIAKLNDLRNLLGDFNDLVELEGLGAPSAFDSEVLKIIRTERKKLLHQARKAWKPLFGEKTNAFIKDIGAIWPQSQT